MWVDVCGVGGEMVIEKCKRKIPVLNYPVVFAMFVCVIAHYQNGMVQMSGGAGGLVVDTSVIELNMV